MVLGSVALLWYRGRAAPQPRPAPQVAGDPGDAATASADLSALAPTLTGRTLGSCRVDEKLGEGGMGQVYKGYHPMLARTVAIKILPPALVQSEEMRARFLQEARIAAVLRHSNIVQIYDFGQAPDGLFFMTMEFVDGTSLKERLARLRGAGELMPMGQAVEIARQIASALAYAHERDAIHRDLKPANVLLTERGQAILVDFGLAVLQGGPRYTEPGKVWGSPTYIAPEQLGEPPQVDGRSDLYSLGILLYEMVTGQPPFKGDSVMETLWQQVNVPPRPPSELAPDLPPELEATILKALAKSPDQRFASAQEMADALEGMDGGQ
jgi:serine/threonine-protein kinase